MFHYKNIFLTLLLGISLLSGCNSSNKDTVKETVEETVKNTLLSVINRQELNVTLPEKSNQHRYLYSLQIAPLASDITLNYHTENGSAIAGQDYTETKGTLTLAKGSTQIDIAIDIIGDDNTEKDETFNLIIDSIKGAELANNATQLTATITLINDDDAIFSLLDQKNLVADLIEKNTRHTHLFSIKISPLKTETTLDYYTKNGTAIAGQDYAETKGTLTLAKGSTQIDINIDIIGDDNTENDETFNLIIDNIQGGELASNATQLTVNITLINDDATFSLLDQNNLTANIPEKDTRYTHLFALQISPLETAITLNYQTKNGTAIAGSDYIETKGTLTLAKGSTRIEIAIDMMGDQIPEENESFSLIVNNIQGGTFADNTTELIATITLTNDDALFAMLDQQELGVNLMETNANYTHTFSLQISPLEADITLDYHTENESATAGSDYTETKGTLTLAKGTTDINIPLDLIGDDTPEKDETFDLVFDNIQGGIFANNVTALRATLHLENDDAIVAVINPLSLSITLSEQDNQYHYLYRLQIAPLETNITLDYHTENNTAIASLDYIEKTGTLALAQGTTYIEIDLEVLPDTLAESDETFNLVINNLKRAKFSTDITHLSTTITIKDDYDTTLANNRALTGTLISSIPPLLAIESLPEQPDAFANVLLVGTNDSETITCPDSGTFSYVFTDINADHKYNDINDIFAISVAQCTDGENISNGDYTLTLKANNTTATQQIKETEIVFNALNITDGSTSSAFTGSLHLTSTDALNGIDPLIITTTSTQIQLNDTYTYDFSALSSTVSTDSITNEKTITAYTATVALSNSPYNGRYEISIIEPLKKSALENYPYSGTIKINDLNSPVSMTLTVIDQQQVTLGTDLTGNNVIDHLQSILWSDLSDPF